MNKYNFERQFIEVFRQNGLDIGLLLRNCQLPEDLFNRSSAMLTGEEYFAVVEQAGLMSSNPTVVLNVATVQQVETFIPASFMAYCSDCGLNFLRRFSDYDRLVAPVRIHVIEKDDIVQLTLKAVPEDRALPSVLVEFKMAYLTNILRKATLHTIVPLKVESVHRPFSNIIKDYLGCEVQEGCLDRITFKRSDLLLPFQSRNDSMLKYIEPELKRRLSEMDEDDDIVSRVRSALTELLPIGKTRIEDVAMKLCMSVRTLQRRLTERHTNYQQQLSTTRMLQAQNYLRCGTSSREEIAFLLGYDDTTAFLRAFNSWTGMTISEFISQNK